MTPHIFRKYPGYNPNEIKDWSPSTVIDTNSFEVEDIVISKGSSKAGTAIPSPLARMELFDTAFHIVADERSNLKGKSIYHKLVSECLDVLQMVFNTRNGDIGLTKKIWFKEWKVRENIDLLKAKGEQHPNYLLGKSLDQIFSDKINNRFADLDSIFLVYYEQKLVGGTSPLTLFFTSPNWSRHISDGKINDLPQSADGYVFFSDDYKALYERDSEFVAYVYKLLLQNKSAFEKAEGFRKYINKTIESKLPNWKNEFAEFRGGYSDVSPMNNEYEMVRTNVGDSKYLTVSGLYFYHQKEGKEQEKISAVSDFIVRASNTKYSIQVNEKGEEQIVRPPLVLVDGMNYSGDYLEKNTPWNSSTKIKDFYHRFVPLYERKLPQGNSPTVTYPFITTDDFLEDNLVEMPFNINSGKFFSGFKGDFKYLLPIKKEYFNFFTINDLKNNLTIVLDEGLIKVSLKVPIKNKKGVPDILFYKAYSKAKGTVVECRADVGVFPFYQLIDSDQNNYTILLANRIEKEKDRELLSLNLFSFKDFASDSVHLEKSTITRSIFDEGGATATSKYYKVKTAFDYMELAYHYNDIGSQCSGLIIPNFAGRSFGKGDLIKSYTFAIDFGTSNTHVAYMENGEALPKPFEITEADQQMVLLNEPGKDADLDLKYATYGRFPAIDLTLRREFLPAMITSKSETAISFPFKTATCEVIDFSNTDKAKMGLFSHINVGYYIDKEETGGNVIYTTNLKWLLERGNDDLNQRRVKFFLEQLLWQIKAKTILNSGKLSELKVVWSVPLSMKKGDRTTLERLMQDAFKEVFGDGRSGATAELKKPIPESVAPYFYLTKSGDGIKDTANAVNIDIGGGTTDIMMFMESAGNREDKYLTTSFRFAGNDLWGSGFNGKLKDNGFLGNYLAYQKANNINPEENKFFKRGTEDGNQKADDLVSMLFKYDNKFKFSDSITVGNPNLSLILYLHFSAIIYHIIQVIELKQYPLPRYLSFTGKGSQYIKLICGGSESELEEFTKLLIKTYTDRKIQGSFKIHLNSNPKEITANGSVLYALAGETETEKYSTREDYIHPGFDPEVNTDFVEKLAFAGKSGFLIGDISEVSSPLNIAVLNNLNSFLDKTFNNRAIIDFLGEFKVKNLKPSYDELRWNGDIDNGEGLIYDSYRKVLNSLKNEDKENQLPESLFFFALKDALYQLSKSIIGK